MSNPSTNEPTRVLSRGQSPSTTAMATVERPAAPYALRSPIAKMLTSDAARTLLEPIMPRGATIDQFIFEAYHAVTQNPEILECTEQSIVLAIGRAIESGLLIGKTIHLVPVNTKISKKDEKLDRYEKRLQAWFDYRGEIELVMRAGVARFIDAHPVYKNEEFSVEQGTNPNIRHVPILDSRARGPMIGGYAYAVLPGRLLKIYTMTIDEVEAVRKNSKQWKYLDTCPPWYMEKTCIHRVTKTLPKNEKLAKIIKLFDAEDREDRDDRDDDGESGESAQLALDPTKQISGPAAVAGAEADFTPDSAAEWTPPSERVDQQTEEEADAPHAEPRKRYAVEEERMPFGQSTVGRPLWQISTIDLASGYDFAVKTRRYKQFADAAEAVLEGRRLGDIPEPTAEDLSAPKPEPAA